MDAKIINRSLETDLKDILTGKLAVSKGKIGKKSTIETKEAEPLSYTSYIYRSEKDRDADLATVSKLLAA